MSISCSACTLQPLRCRGCPPCQASTELLAASLLLNTRHVSAAQTFNFAQQWHSPVYQATSTFRVLLFRSAASSPSTGRFLHSSQSACCLSARLQAAMHSTCRGHHGAPTTLSTCTSPHLQRRSLRCWNRAARLHERHQPRCTVATASKDDSSPEKDDRTQERRQRVKWAFYDIVGSSLL